MIQTKSTFGMPRSAASAVRFAMLAGGLSIAWAANAANCTAAPVSGKSYNIVNEDSGPQLDVIRASPDVGADVIQWPSNRQTNQQWAFGEMSRGIWTINAVHRGQAPDLLAYNPRTLRSSSTPIRAA